MATKEKDTLLTGDRKTGAVFVPESPPTAESTHVHLANTGTDYVPNTPPVVTHVPVTAQKKEDYIQGTPPRRRNSTNIIDTFDNTHSTLVKLLQSADSQSFVFFF